MFNMLFDLDKRDPQLRVAIDDYGDLIVNQDVVEFTNEIGAIIEARTLVFILAENSIGALLGYISCLSLRIVPLILSAKTDRQLVNDLMELYKPKFIWAQEGNVFGSEFRKVYSKYGFVLLATNCEIYPLHPSLALLLPTSGSTGSSKLVRHSYLNIIESAKNVAEFFQISSEDRPIVSLPMHYTMGLSVITSHLLKESTLLITNRNLTDKSFWDFVRENRATCFTGVPYSYEILHRLRVFRMDLPDLKVFTQGGGKLKEDIFKAFAEYAELTGKKFIATYGQTEGTARMAYLSPELATVKIGSIGTAIPGGQLWLVDKEGEIIDEIDTYGQLVYSGKNVTLGYSSTKEDLKKGDENNGVLYTGDLARRDSDGCYYIVGRISRFLKIYGSRYSLDEIEGIIKSDLNIDCVCTGVDDQLKILITESSLEKPLIDLIVKKMGIFHKAIVVEVVLEIPRNEYGKIVYRQ